MKSRLSIDTDFEFYRAIIARTQNSIADDDFIVHRGDINKPDYSCAFMNFHEKYQTFKVRSFPSSDVRFKYYSCAFMNFHEKI